MIGQMRLLNGQSQCPRDESLNTYCHSTDVEHWSTIASFPHSIGQKVFGVTVSYQQRLFIEARIN